MSRERSYKKSFPPIDLDFTLTSIEFETEIGKKEYTEHSPPNNSIVMMLNHTSQQSVLTANQLRRKKLTTLAEYFAIEKDYLGAMALKKNSHLIFELANLYNLELRKHNSKYHIYFYYAFEYYKMFVGIKIFNEFVNLKKTLNKKTTNNVIEALDNIISYYENCMYSPENFKYVKFDISVLIAYKYIRYLYTADSEEKQSLLKTISSYKSPNFTKKNTDDITKYLEALNIIRFGGKTRLTNDGKEMFFKKSR